MFGKDHADSFLLLETGRADAFVMDGQILAGNIAKAKNPADFRIVGEVLSVEPIAIMIRKDDPAFKQAVDVRDVRAMDSSGAAMLSGLVEHARALDQRPVIVGLSGEAKTQFLSSGGEGLLEPGAVATGEDGPALGEAAGAGVGAEERQLADHAAGHAEGQRGHLEAARELIGQGLGNLACAFFGGIPVTGVIARSGANVQAGAKTRRAAIIHALALLVAVYATASVIERIPIPALAAVLFSVAFRMLSPASFLKLWRHSRADGAVFAVTFMVIVFVDLLEGVRWGVVAALAIAALRLGRPEVLVHGARLDGHYVFALGGPLTFL